MNEFRVNACYFCPSCDDPLYHEKEYAYCCTEGCQEEGKRYELPKVELKEYNE